MAVAAIKEVQDLECLLSPTRSDICHHTRSMAYKVSSSLRSFLNLSDRALYRGLKDRFCRKGGVTAERPAAD